ncbi:hypothetical protein EZV62_016839 [Acer yangbiense]|uniref:Integrase catalytic domain-containing protein n=1 Tax=Acer yangbiense TaxID=1000413 RepID=A0A5C7HPK9_9ROSI|nr:hypothetical protein EZV62_016839 [Acer yangbiense]
MLKYRAACHPTNCANPSPILNRLLVVKWLKPNEGFYKVNTDVAIRTGLKKIGIDIIIQDSEGRVMGFSTQCMDALFHPLIAESTTLFRGSLFVMEAGLLSAVIESDAKAVVDLAVKSPLGEDFCGIFGTLRKRLIKEGHCSAMSGHSRIKGIVKRLQHFFYWDTLNKDVVGRENIMVDGLSRAMSSEEGNLAALTTNQPNWVLDVQESYQSDQIAMKRLIKEGHCSAMSGHSGIKGIVKRLQHFFYWDTMNKDIVVWVTQCTTCQQCKGLPISQGKDTISVVIDILTKYAHFLTLTHPFTANIVAKVFFDNIHKLHGIPTTITSDRDRIFTSTFWQGLFRLVGTKLCLSTAYHSLMDGQSERLNQCLENYIRCMTGARPGKWASWLPMVEWWYNSNHHTSLTMTPFGALYGYKPPIFSFTALEISSPYIRDFTYERGDVQTKYK